MQETGTSPGPEGSALLGRKLDSWKEIADYLGREVRTVQRWEKTEDLPVHRHGHKKKSTVYAYSAELDDWFKKRQPKDDPDADAAFELEPDVGDAPADSENGDVVLAEEVPRPSVKTAGSPSDDTVQPKPWRWKRPVLAAAATAVLCFAAYGAYRWIHLRNLPPEKVRLVVLPFTNLSGDPTKDFLSRGMTDVITTQLGQLDPEHLGVIAPTSAAVMSGHPVAEVREKLKVQYIFEGGVQPVGDQVRIDIRLIQASDETQAGSKSFTRPFANVLELESEVAETMAHMMVATLPAAVPAAASPGAVSTEAATKANEAFLKAEALWTSRSNLKSSIDLFEEATRQNPYNAQAFAGLAGATALIGQVPNDGMSPADAKPKAREAALRALQLDPKLAEPHAVLGNVAMSYDWDFANSEKEFKTAIRLNPNYPTAHEWYAHLLMVQGRYAEALAESQHVLELEPATPLFHSVRAEILYYSRNYDEALQETAGVLKTHPDFVLAYYWQGCAYREKKRYAEAIATFDQARKLTGDSPFIVMAYGHTQALAGNEKEARKALRTLTQMQKSRLVPDVYLAAIYLGLGEKDRAFQSLDKAYQNRIDRLVYLNVEPMADPLRSDPRMEQLLSKIGLVSEKRPLPAAGN